MRTHSGLLVVMAVAALVSRSATADPAPRDTAPLPRLPLLVPFPDCGSTVLMPVRVNGGEPRLFILDSGANSIVLDNAFADELGLRPTASGEGKGAGAGPVAYRRYPRDSVEFDVAGVKFRSGRTISFDLSNQPGILGYRVGGVLGTDFFRRVAVEIDYDARAVRLHDPAKVPAAVGAHVVPLRFARDLPYFTARLKVPGRPERERLLLVDSGSEDAVDDSLLLESRGPLRRVLGGVGAGRTYEVVFGRVERFTVGPFVLRDLPSVAPGVALIGGEVLRRFRVTFDYAGGRMLLVAGRHFADDVPEDLSGLTLRLADGGTRLRVEDVTAGSAAANAGIRAGDAVVSVDGATAGEVGLRRTAALLMVPGRLRLGIEGAAGAREIELSLTGARR